MGRTDVSRNQLWNEGANHTVDVACVWIDVEGAEHLLLIQRPDGTWALPGGFIDQNETPSEAAVRELYEETGLQVPSMDLVHEGRVYDPREGLDRWVETTLFSGLLRDRKKPPVWAGDDAKVAEWVRCERDRRRPKTACLEDRSALLYADHRFLVRQALEWREWRKK